MEFTISYTVLITYILFCSGNVTALTYGVTMVMPSPHFNPRECLDAIEKEKCTSIYGTPFMFTDLISAQRIQKRNLDSVETGIMAGKEIYII